MLKRQLVCAVAVVLLQLSALGTGAAQAGLMFDIKVDTSSLSMQDGFLDFQFNPGDSSAKAATAGVTLFQAVSGSLTQPASLTGDATGSLPGALILHNGMPYNDAFQGFTFGTSFDFKLTLSGPAIDSPGGTTGSAFSLSLYAADGMTPLLTTDPNGSAATIYLNANGTTSVSTFPQSSTNNAPAVTVTPSRAVPEPSTLVLVLFAVAWGLISFCRSRW